MAYTTLRYEQEGSVGILTLNRPDCLNAVNQVMLEELHRFFSERQHDAQVRVLILTGAGRGFCSGMDLKEFAGMTPPGGFSPAAAYAFQRTGSELILLMRRIPQPLIGAINGPAAGAGLCFALACDVRLATASAKFVAAFINLGLGGADLGSSWLMPRAMGTANAARYLLTGEPFGVAEALRMGLIQAQLEQPALMEESIRLATVMAEKSPLGLRLTKEALDANAGGMSLEEAIRLEDRNQALCLTQART